MSSLYVLDACAIIAFLKMTIRLPQKPLPQLGLHTRHRENPGDLLHQKSTEPSLILTVKVGFVRVISPGLRGWHFGVP